MIGHRLTRKFGKKIGYFLYGQSCKGGWIHWWLVDGKKFGVVHYDK